MAPTLPYTALPSVEVFAVDAHSAQLCWRDLPEGMLSAVVHDHETVLGDSGRPGIGDIHGLAPNGIHPLDLFIDHRIIWQSTIRTGPPIDGPSLCRVATVSDLHLGETAFGLTRTMRDRSSSSDPYPLRCAIAAVREATAWGAELLVFKGDITHSGLPSQWELFDRLLQHVEVPIMAIPGNHDVVGVSGSVDHHRALDSRGIDSFDVQKRTLDGVTILAVDSTIPGKGSGTFTGRLEDLLIAIDTRTPALIFTHHHFELTPVRYFWPPGIPLAESGELLRAIAEANPNSLLSSGHTHRNRSSNVNGMLLTEVGSAKDHPGVWAGYEVHPSGVRQTVRRIADPDCVQWTERTRRAVAGIWGKWAPGTLEQRSIAHTWPAHAPSSAPRVGHRSVAVVATDSQSS